MLNNNRRHPSDHPLDERVASLLAAAAAPTESGPAPGEEEVLAAFRASHETPRRSFMRSPITPAKTALAAAVGAGVLLTGGVAAAATGSLPGAAQDKASEMLTKVGVTVPGADEHAAGNPDQRGSSADDDAETEETEETTEGTEESAETPAVEDDGSEDTESHGKGEAVRELARSEETTGVEKGAAVSGYASEGKSKAGQNHQQGKPAEDDTEEPADGTEGDDADESSTGETKSAERRTDGEEKSAEQKTDGQSKAAEKRPASDDDTETDDTESDDTASDDAQSDD